MENSLKKHAGEFTAALASHKYERTGDERGLLPLF